jgi:hypothetical protein
LRCVASIITASVDVLSPARTAKIRSKTPIRLQRMRRL